MTPEQPRAKYRTGIFIIALIMVLTGILLALARGITRDAIVIPLLYALWSFFYVLDGIPQSVIWAVMLLFAIAMAIRNIAPKREGVTGRQSAQDSGASVGSWARLLSHAQHDQFARWRTAQRLALLAAEQLADYERIELRRARHKIESGGLVGMSPQVHAYLRAGLAANRPNSQGLRTYLRRRSPDALDLDPAEAIAWLENMRNETPRSSS